MPMIKMANGIQNHTTDTAAPVIIDAVGTTPRWRTGVVTAPWAAATAGAELEVTATMPSTYGHATPCDTAFCSEPMG